MLKTIKCDKFINQPITSFQNGLNCILGDDNGSNSIGKSTFLMVIDYAFGGDAYYDIQEIHKNIGNHRIEFTFFFNGNDYTFYRDYFDNKNVFNCNDNKLIKIEEYREWLKKMYGLDTLMMSFRDIVSVFLRIYGKSHINEKQPLLSHSKEGAETSILRLIKLFEKYSEISDIEQKVKDSKEKLKSYKQAQKFEFISSINKKTYKSNIIKIKELNKQIEDLINRSDRNYIDLDSFKLEQVKTLENEKSKLLRKKTEEKSILTKLENSISDIDVFDKLDEKELLSFFPNINIGKLRAIQTFHSALRTNLKNEISDFISEKNIIITALDEKIKETAKKISEITNQKQSLSKIIIAKLIDLQKEIENLSRQNKEFDNKNTFKAEETNYMNQYDNLFMKEILIIQDSINNALVCLNNSINPIKNSPIISFKNKKSYIFETDDDNGTGTNYKNLIMFDLAISIITKLPFFIHDSIMFKHIENNTIENILSLYNQSAKQIFIAFDKISSYSNETIKILKQNQVISLSSNGKELYGRCWNNKQ